MMVSEMINVEFMLISPGFLFFLPLSWSKYSDF